MGRKLIVEREVRVWCDGEMFAWGLGGGRRGCRGLDFEYDYGKHPDD